MANNEQTYVDGFDEAALKGLATQEEGAGVLAARQSAYEEYQAVPMPTSRMEEWRRTDPARFPFARMAFQSKYKVVEASEDSWDSEFDVVVAVEDGGYSVRDVSGALADGKVIVVSIDEAFSRHPELADKYLNTHLRGDEGDKFEALNDAFWNFGVFIYVPPKATLEHGVLIRYRQSVGESILIPRVVVAAGEQSSGTVVERYQSPDDVAVLSVAAKQSFVEEAAQLKIVTLRDWGDGAYHLASDWVKLGRDSRIDWITLNLGGKVSKLRFGSNGAAPGANAELDGLFFANDSQHVDQKTLQIHSAPNTYSRLLYKGVVKDTARSVYQGLIVAKPGAIKVDAYQTNNNIVLNDGAQADSLPGLVIDADDLKCSHGSTVGNLSDEEIFYLQSRGLDETMARKILIKGFFEEIAGRISHDCVREAVQRHIDDKIG